MIKIKFGKRLMEKPSKNRVANPKNLLDRAELSTEENNSIKKQLSHFKDNLRTNKFKDYPQSL